MCGICGKYYFQEDKRVEEELIKRMCQTLVHRGPDDEGIYVDRNIGLGHRRLSIIDLATGKQPIHNEDKSIWIVFNGEIYNFLELRSFLEKKGHKFYTKSDTETIVHLYEEEGENCIKKLRGMFAFALWDEGQKKLILARDRVGKKPLFYTLSNKTFIFASEIKSILQDLLIKKEVSLESLHSYLTYGYIPAPETIFRGIKKLPPAHFLIVQKGRLRLKRYWDLNFTKKINLTEQEIVEQVYELVKEAVKIRLISDVPLGAFLSGGIDSSIVVALMSQLVSEPVKTFSIGFKEASFDELKYAQLIAKHFRTDHHEFIVKPDALTILPELIWYFDEPFADSSAIPTYYVAKMTRQHVTVALNGDGGDEAFAGYERYFASRLADYYSLIPAALRENVIEQLVKNLPESTAKKGFFKRLKRFVKAAGLPSEERYTEWMTTFSDEMKSFLYTSELKENLSHVNSSSFLKKAFESAQAGDFLDKLLYVDTVTYLPNDLLVKMDRMSMVHSLEARSPFLDHKVMEFAAAIPHNLKLKRMTTKYILKKAMKNLLPQKIISRGKAGFGVPIGVWFKEELKEFAYQILLDKRARKRGYFNSKFIEQLLEEHIMGKIDHGNRIWALLVLELWHQTFIDRANLAGPLIV